MASLIHLVRHGEVDNPRHVVYASLPGFGLSERGRRQAAETARYMAASPIVAVWSSPLERALDTAGAVAARHRLPVRVHHGLIEWHLADGWKGIVWEALPEERPGQLEAYLAHPWDLDFGDETLDECAARIAAVAREAHEAHPDGEVVLVGHQDPMQAGRLRLTGRWLSDQHTDKPAHGTVISLRPGTPWREVTRFDPAEQEAFPPR